MCLIRAPPEISWNDRGASIVASARIAADGICMVPLIRPLSSLTTTAITLFSNNLVHDSRPTNSQPEKLKGKPYRNLLLF